MNIDQCFRNGLLRRTQPSPRSVEKSLSMSLRFIGSAEENLEMKNHGLVLFCSYTSMFHAARAILFRDGIKERSHICIAIYVGETYPQLKDLARMLDVYRMSRHTSIYSLDAEGDENDARLSLIDARSFYGSVVKFLGK